MLKRPFPQVRHAETPEGRVQYLEQGNYRTCGSLPRCLFRGTLAWDPEQPRSAVIRMTSWGGGGVTVNFLPFDKGLNDTVVIYLIAGVINYSKKLK